MRPFNPFDKDGCVCLGCNLPSTAPNSIFTTRSRIDCYIECKLTNNGTKMHQCYYSLIDGSCSRTRTFQILIFGISNPSNSITCSKATNEIFFVLYQRLVKYNEKVMLSLEYERLFFMKLYHVADAIHFKWSCKRVCGVNFSYWCQKEINMKLRTVCLKFPVTCTYNSQHENNNVWWTEYFLKTFFSLTYHDIS